MKTRGIEVRLLYYYKKHLNLNENIKIALKITKTQSQSRKKFGQFLQNELFVHWTLFD